MDSGRRQTKFLDTSSAGSESAPGERVLCLSVPGNEHSLVALHDSDGVGDSIVRPSPELDGFLAVVLLEPMDKYTIRRDARPIDVAPAAAGAFGFHDLRRSWWRPKLKSSSVSFVFSRDYLNSLGPRFGHRGMDIFKDRIDYGTPDQTLLHLALAVMPCLSNPESFDTLFMDQLFLTACSYLSTKYGALLNSEARWGRLSPEQERRAKEFLRSNMRERITLSQVAALFGISSSHFARLFKETTGLSPYKWLLNEKVVQAKILLEVTRDPLPDVASACGFSDQSHFTRTFSNNVGISPGLWRRMRT